MRKVFAVSLFFLISTLVFGCSETQDSSNDLQKEVDKIISELENADRYIDKSMNAVIDKDYDGARNLALKAKQSINNAKNIYLRNDDKLNVEDAELLAKFIEYEDRWATLAYKTANIQELGNNLFGEALDEEPDLALPKVELLERGYRENAKDWEELAIFLDRNLNDLQRMGIGKDDVDTIYGLSYATYDLADALKEYSAVLRSKVEDYSSVSEREIVSESFAGADLIPKEVSEFFDRFDKDRNNKLSIGEAQEFFYWVENNVKYRYDDENAENTVLGLKVGDGREGKDYRQTPLETLNEGAGDCEDMATLEVAFYRHFGIEAYVVGIDTTTPGIVDHAAAIVKIGENKETFRRVLGNLLYYEIENASDIYGGNVSDGVYMIVDNSYSGAFGYISGGVENGTFTIHCIIPLERGYGEEWYRVVDKCVSMD